MATFTARARRGRAMRRGGAGTVLALALCWTAPAAATSTTQVLAAAPGDAVVHLDPAGGANDVLRQLAMERGKSTFIKAGYSVKRVSVGNPAVLRSEERRVGKEQG